MRLSLVRTAVFAVGLLGYAGYAQATPVTFNFTTPLVANTLGTVSFTSSIPGITATAQGWALTGAGGTFQTAYLDSFASPATGLGVCNQGPGSDGDIDGSTLAAVCIASNTHEPYIDDIGPDDYVLLTFSQAIQITSVGIHGNGTDDTDGVFWLGNISDPNLASSATTLAGLAGRGFLGFTDVPGTSASTSLAVSNSGSFNAILIGTKALNTDGENDRFRITGLTGNAVPEPSSMLLLGTGLAGLARFARRRKS